MLSTNTADLSTLESSSANSVTGSTHSQTVTPTSSGISPVTPTSSDISSVSSITRSTHSRTMGSMSSTITPVPLNLSDDTSGGEVDVHYEWSQQDTEPEPVSGRGFQQVLPVSDNSYQEGDNSIYVGCQDKSSGGLAMVPLIGDVE